MRMTKCTWKNADGKLPMTLCRLWGKINLRRFLKVLFVNKPSHLIELRPREVQYFILNCKQVKTF